MMRIICAVVFSLWSVFSLLAHAQGTLNVLASLDTYGAAALIAGRDGQLYGAGPQCCGNYGVIFRLSPATGQFTVLHQFSNTDGWKPLALLQGIDGNFYGVTEQGGGSGCTNGCGVVFKMNSSSPYTLTVIHGFEGNTVDGYQPYFITQGSDGTLYGLAYEGNNASFQYGEIFSLNTSGSNFQVLHSFSGTDGSQPTSLLPPYSGVLYGAEPLYGPSNDGEVFAINSDGSNFNIVHGFTGGSDGGNPVSLARTNTGGLYGVAQYGPDGQAPVELFEMNSDGSITVIHSFASNGSEGTCALTPSGLCTLAYIQPSGGSVLLGTACCGGSGNAGTIFEFNLATNNFSVAYSFTGGLLDPDVPLTQVPGGGPIYGATAAGGTYGNGVIYLFSVPNSSQVWARIGPDVIQRPGFLSAAGKLQALVVDNANPAVMYAAGGIGPGNSGPSTEAGIYKTTNGGTSWAQSNAGLTDHVVDALWLDQSNPNTILAGTNTLGIFISTNAGATWKLEEQFGATTAFLQVGTTLYASTAEGIASSSNSGTSWSIAEPTTSPVRALAAGGGLIYAGLDNGQVLVYSSGTWTTTTPTTDATAWSIAVNPGNPQNAFVVDWNGYTSPSLYVTQNAGSNWATVTSTTNCPSSVNNAPAQVVAWDFDNGILYAGCDFYMSQSLDNGNTWTQITGANWDVRLIVTDFASLPGNLAAGTDQGLYLSKNQGSTWQSINGNITSSILFALAVKGATILTAAQDFSPISTFDGGKTWSNLESGAAVGEAGTVVINPGNTKYAYFFTTSGFYYSTNGGQTFTFDSALPSAQFPQTAGNGDLVAVDTQNPSTVYVAAVSGVYKSTNWGISWTLQSTWPSQPVMVGVDPANSNNIFVGQQNGTLMISHNGGTTWTASSLACTNCGSPVSLAVDPSNSQNMLIGMSLAPSNILVSTNGGSSFVKTFPIPTSAVSTNLCQAGAVPHLHFDPSGSGIVAAATNSGAYTSSNLGTTWSNISANAVPYAFTDLVWSGGYLYASTCGEGVLRLPFSE
jgi:uncharacterized repeat protein (TIGR03803 family)